MTTARRGSSVQGRLHRQQQHHPRLDPALPATRPRAGSHWSAKTRRDLSVGSSGSSEHFGALQISSAHAPLGCSTCYGSGGCRPPPPVAAPLASSLHAPSRGDPPLRGRGVSRLPPDAPGRGRGARCLLPEAQRLGPCTEPSLVGPCADNPGPAWSGRATTARMPSLVGPCADIGPDAQRGPGVRWLRH